jgi:indole-3-glycerol phosphate synthase
MSILDKIFATKHSEVSQRLKALPLEELQHQVELAHPALDFLGTLKQPLFPGYPVLISEIKHRSPSGGVLVEEFNPLNLARIYQQNGAGAVSILTDEQYFGGHIDDLRQVKTQNPRLPVLRKDFIFHPYQVWESRAAGADAILLIQAMLESDTILELRNLAQRLGMASLIEVHNEVELRRALELKPALIGINNRNLHTFEVALETTFRLREQIPVEICVVAESGIRTQQDVLRLAEAKINAILVGESLVRAPDIGMQARILSGMEMRATETGK